MIIFKNLAYKLKRSEHTSKVYLVAFVLLFIFSFAHKINLIYHYDINIDETYALADVSDFTYDARSPGYDIDRKEPVPAIRYYRKSTDRLGMQERIANIQLLFGRWYQINVHPPLTTVLIKLMTPGERDFIVLRWWALAMFCIALWVLYLLLRALDFGKIETLISLAIFSSTSVGCFYSIFARPYTPALIFLALIWLIFNNLQKKTSVILLLINLLLCYLCFMTHLFAWLSIIVSFALLSWYYYSENHDKRKLLINLSQILITSSYYLIHYQQIQIQKAIYPRQFLGHHGFGEFFDAANSLFILTTMNFKLEYAWVIILFFCVFAIINRNYFFKDKKNLLLTILILSPFIAVLIADFYANKYAATRIRYFVFALPFISLLLTRLFNRQLWIYTLVMLPLVYFNYSNPALLQFDTINHFIWDKYKFKLDYLVKNNILLKEPFILILPSLDTKGILFVHKYVCAILGVDQLRGPNIDDPATKKLLEKIYIITPLVNINKVKILINKEGVTKVIALMHVDGFETLGPKGHPISLI